MSKNILLENKGREGESIATVTYLHHFIENLDAIKELKYILAYFSKNYGYTDPNKFAFDENNQFVFESIMFSAMTLYSNGEHQEQDLLNHIKNGKICWLLKRRKIISYAGIKYR